jgi:hypothetical protein
VSKRKLTAQEKVEKKRRRLEFMTIFVHGKQKRIRRPPTIEGLDVDEIHPSERGRHLAAAERDAGGHRVRARRVSTT